MLIYAKAPADITPLRHDTPAFSLLMPIRHAAYAMHAADDIMLPLLMR